MIAAEFRGSAGQRKTDQREALAVSSVEVEIKKSEGCVIWQLWLVLRPWPSGPYFRTMVASRQIGSRWSSINMKTMKAAHQWKLKELKQYDADPEQWMKLWRKFPAAWKSPVRTADLGRVPTEPDQLVQCLSPVQCKCCLKNFKSLGLSAPTRSVYTGFADPHYIFVSPRYALLACAVDFH